MAVSGFGAGRDEFLSKSDRPIFLEHELPFRLETLREWGRHRRQRQLLTDTLISMRTKTELDAAYRATTYHLLLPAGALDLRTDQANPAFVAWLKANDVSRWAIMTAANPASESLPKQANAERQARLECALLEKDFEPFAVENRADGDWPTEESCFVPGISMEMAMALGREFGQNAILFGEADGVPRLVWLEEEYRG